METKHQSKLYKGFLKQYKRQENKPREVKLKFDVSSLVPKHLKGKHTYKIWVSNSIWNGMNLTCLKNSFNKDCFNRQIVGGMYGKFSVNSEGKYKLSNYGKELLRKKKQKKAA